MVEPSSERVVAGEQAAHRALHRGVGRYHLAVLIFHLQKLQDPFAPCELPGLNPNITITPEMLEFVRRHLDTLVTTT